MLTAIIVERLGVIERAELEVSGSSVVLTGETGAGKTLVVSATSLLLGARADRALIRAGSKDALVQGLFLVSPQHPVVSLLQAEGIPVDVSGAEVEIVVTRTLAVEARNNRVRINGSLVPLTTLTRIGTMLVEIAGQNEHSRIARPAYQRGLLDAFAGCSELSDRVAAAVHEARAAADRAHAVVREERERHRELNALRHEVAEIERVGPKVGEMGELETSAKRLERAAELAEGSARVSSALRGEGGVEEVLAEAAHVLEDLGRYEPGFADAAARLRGAGLEIGDVAAGISATAAETDPLTLDEVQTRIAALRALRRKHGGHERDVLAHEAWARGRIEELEGAEATAEELHEAAEAAAAEAHSLAAELSRQRAAAASALGSRVEERLDSLALPGVRFVVDLVPSDLYEGGLERVEFRIRANPGEEPGPLGKVTSGGELSRVALALNLVTSTGSARTMVFDEVDAGVGGSAAAEIGRSLASLAEEGIQVIVVTHLPQVAAFADEHHVVSKTIENDRARAVVAKVDGEARVAEVTRMLAGLPESRRGREHARELLELSSGGVPAA